MCLFILNNIQCLNIYIQRMNKGSINQSIVPSVFPNQSTCLVLPKRGVQFHSEILILYSTYYFFHHHHYHLPPPVRTMSGRGVRLTPGYILKTIQSDQFQRVYGKLLKLRAKRFIGMTINKKFTGYGYYLGKIERVSDDDRHVVLFQVSYKDGYTEQLPLSSVWKLMSPTPPPNSWFNCSKKCFPKATRRERARRRPRVKRNAPAPRLPSGPCQRERP